MLPIEKLLISVLFCTNCFWNLLCFEESVKYFSYYIEARKYYFVPEFLINGYG